MDQFKKDIMQAVLIADNNIESFQPAVIETSSSLLPLVNVCMLDYALEALNRSGIQEVFVYASQHVQSIRRHIKIGMQTLSSWSINMIVHVIGGEGCRCFGDAMRDLDAKAVIRGNFLLLGVDTATNTDFRPIFEQHKNTVKYDKGAAATLILKESTANLRTDNELMIAIDADNNRLYHHQRLRMNHKETNFEIPLQVLINNSCIVLHHNILDPQITIGSPTMLSLFSDNFDFQTHDDFVRGILINEELLDSRIYVSLLSNEEYAYKVNNWFAYQVTSRDVMNRWAYPLVPDMGVHKMSQHYVCQKNNIYKSSEASITKKLLRENVVLEADTIIDVGSSISNSVIGKNCRIGQNCVVNNAFIMASVTIGNNCVLQHCVIGTDVRIGENSVVQAGTVLGTKCILPPNSKLSNALVCSQSNAADVIVKRIGSQAYIMNDTLSHYTTSDSEDDELFEPELQSIPKLQNLSTVCKDSDYSSSSDENESHRGTPLPDDTNLFLSEVMDSLTRGYLERSNTAFLILEINSSRYAYNMSLKEVNFNVVKAIFSMQHIQEPPNGNILLAIKNVFQLLGPVVVNYIKSEDAMVDCLKALEDICQINNLVHEKISQIIHYLYDNDFISEDSILTWYSQLNEDTIKRKLTKLIDWLKQSSEEDDDDDDDDNNNNNNDDDTEA